MAMFVPDISVPLGIAGSTGSTSVSFILPALFYLKLSNAPQGSR
jgi:amino acid permease